jgi:hypothetical protein
LDLKAGWTDPARFTQRAPDLFLRAPTSSGCLQAAKRGACLTGAREGVAVALALQEA